MQTFLPFPDFSASAEVLDRQRLGKQRLEVFQLLEAIHLFGGGDGDPPYIKGRRNHPIARAWLGHTGSLLLYGLAICDQWIGRGYRDSMRPRICALRSHVASDAPPPWLGRPRVHSHYRSILLAKDPEHYGGFGWSEPPWPADEKMRYELLLEESE